MGTTIENRISSTQAKDAIFKAHSINSSASEIDGKVIPVDTIADLRAKTVSSETVWLSGYHTKNDGAFGSNIFRWNPTSTATDNGGTIIKLTSVTTGRYELQFSGAVNVKWFGAKGDGITDDTLAIQKCFLYGADVVSDKGKVYLISGSTPITISCNVEFNGSYFKPINFNSEIKINNHVDVSTITSGNEYLDYFKTQGMVLKGARWLPVLDDRYEGYFIVINTSQDFYRYRGTTQKRNFYTVLKREKQSDSPLDYDLNTSLITSIELYKINDKKITISGMNFLESLQTNYNLINIYGTNIDYKDSYFKKVGNNQLAPYSRIKVAKSAYINISNIFTNTPILTTNKEYSYTLTMENSYEINLQNINSDGDGWGSVGNNDCSRVSFDKCRLNRIDFHNPYRDFLKITNSIIGDWGVTVSGIGDLIIDNTEFLCKSGTVATLIAVRPDVGFIDGNLRMTNCTYSGGGTRTYSIISANLSTDSGVVVGSPITGRIFNNIIIENFEDDTNSTRSYSIIGNTSPAVFVAPGFISLKNFRTRGTNITLLLNLDNFISNQNLGVSGVLPNYFPYSTVINIDGCNFGGYYFTGRGINHFVNVNISKCTGGTLNPASFFFQMMGSYLVEQSSINTITTTYNSYTAEDFLDIKVVNSLVNNPSQTIISFDETKDQTIRLLNNTIFYREATQPAQIAKCVDMGNKIINRL